MHERPYVWRGLMVLWCGELGERPYLGWGRMLLWCGAARLRGSAPGPSLLGAERQPSRDTLPRRGLRHSELPSWAAGWPRVRTTRREDHDDSRSVLLVCPEDASPPRLCDSIAC